MDWQAVYLPIGSGSEADLNVSLKGLKKIYDERVDDGEFLLVGKEFYFHPTFLGYPSLLSKKQFNIDMVL